MLKISTIHLDTDDMKKLRQIAKKDGVKTAYLVRKAIKEFLERKERENELDRIGKKDKLKGSHLVRKAFSEFIERKEQESSIDWGREFIEQAVPPKK